MQKGDKIKLIKPLDGCYMDEIYIIADIDFEHSSGYMYYICDQKGNIVTKVLEDEIDTYFKLVSVDEYNIGSSDYSSHKIQPWDIWEEYHLNPWDADIIKRVLRIKSQQLVTPRESRIEDYNKIIHICQKRIEQIQNGYEF